MKRMMLMLLAVCIATGCSLFDNSVNEHEDKDTGPTITVVLQNENSGYNKAGFFYIGTIENYNDSFYLYKEVPIQNGQFSFNLPTIKPKMPYMYFSFQADTAQAATVIAFYSINLYMDNCIDTALIEGGNNETYNRYNLKGQLEGVYFGLENQGILCDTTGNDWYFRYAGGEINTDTTVYWDLGQ